MPVNQAEKRIALYARVSSEEQREGQTIDSQVAELERFAGQNTWRITGIYKDEGWSGGILARPELDRLRDDASKGLFDAVLINDVDRLARDVTHLGVIKRDLERRGVQVIFRKLPAESSPTHNLMVNILGSFAEFERELIADRTRRGRRHKVEVRQQFLGSIAPYGFRYQRRDPASGKEGLLEINPEEAAIVRRIFSWVAEDGLSARQVVSRLNRERIPPRKGNREWAKSSVLRILRSEVYTGVWYYNKYESCEPKTSLRKGKYQRSPKSSMRRREQREWIPVQLSEQLRIVPREQWSEIQQQLDKNKAFSPRNSRHNYLLRGLIRCAGCGARYVGEPNHGKFYYRCLARCKKVPTVKENRLNEGVWTTLQQAILNPQLLAESVLKLNQKRITERGASRAEASNVEEGLRQLDAEESRLLEAYRRGVISAEQLGMELEKLKARRASLEATKAELDDDSLKLTVPEVTRSVFEYCQLIAGQLDATTVPEKQRLLRLLVNEIIYDGSSVRIKGVIPLRVHSETQGREPASAAGSQALLGRIATTEIETSVLNANPEPVDRVDLNCSGSQLFPFLFELGEPVSDPPPPARDVCGRFVGRTQLLRVFLRQLLVLGLSRAQSIVKDRD